MRTQNEETKEVQPYTAIHENQNPSTYLIMLSKTQTSACYLFPASNEDLSLKNVIVLFFTLAYSALWVDHPKKDVHYSNYTNAYKHMVEEAKSTQPSIIPKKRRTCTDQLR